MPRISPIDPGSPSEDPRRYFIASNGHQKDLLLADLECLTAEFDDRSLAKNRKDSDFDDEPDVCADGALNYLSVTFTEMLTGSYLNVLLVFMPIALLTKYYNCSESWIFTSALLALIPCAERVSFVTEDLAKYTNETLGGLLNATFGNVTELVVCIFAIKAGLFRVVQLSMLGSVLSNLLLVLGSAFLVGGMRFKEQKFNRPAAITNSGLLIVSVLALSLPSILDAAHDGAGGVHQDIVVKNLTIPVDKVSDPFSWLRARGNLEAEDMPGGDSPIWLSRFIAVLMLLLYSFLILFQLKTHSYLFDEKDDDDGDEEDEEEPGILGFWGGIAWLGIITLFISLLSDFIVDAIEGAAKNMGIPILFLSGILVPIVGNAAEHAAALTFAYRNKMEIALGSAVGSAVQISLFVIPLCVVIGWILDKDMTINFHIFETAVMLLTSLSVALVLVDGRSNWLKGAMLLLAYLMVSAAFWAHADPSSMS